MPEQPGSGQPRADGPPDTAKTPEEMDAEASRFEQNADEIERYTDPAALAAQRAADERAYDEEHALGDAFMGMVGAGTGGYEEDSGAGLMAAMARSRIPGMRQAAKQLRANAEWARRALAGALITFGALMTVGGIAGAGNAPSGPAATPPPTGSAAASASNAATNLPPVAGPIIAVFNAPQTSYTVQASDPEGKTLTYTWTKTNPCGTFTFTGNVAVWNHPDVPGGCPNEAIHPGTITVTISDGVNQIQRVYTQGSAPGTGQVPAGSASPLPTTTSRPETPSATPTATPTSSPGPGGGGGPNVPLAGGGLVVAGAGAGLLLTQEKKKKTCDKEKADEERTRREMEAKKERYDQLNQAKSARDFAAGEARKADAAAAKAAKGVPTGGVSGGPIRFIGPRAGAAQAAADAATAAHDEANVRQNSYQHMGGDAAWQQAKSEYDAAKAAHNAAADALAKCLESIAPAPTPVPDGGGGTTTGGDGGGTTTAGPVISSGGGPTTQQKKQPRCPPGTYRDTPGATPRTLRVSIADMSSVRPKCFDSDDRDIPWDLIDGAMSYATNAKKALSFAGSKVGKISEDAEAGMSPMGPILDFTGTMTDKALEGLQKVIDIYKKKGGSGMYGVTFTIEDFECRCVPRQQCVNDDWVTATSRFEVSSLGAHDARRGGGDERDHAQNVYGSSDTIQNQIGRIIQRYVNQLKAQNDAAVRQMKDFQNSCGS